MHVKPTPNTRNKKITSKRILLSLRRYYAVLCVGQRTEYVSVTAR